MDFGGLFFTSVFSGLFGELGESLLGMISTGEGLRSRCLEVSGSELDPELELELELVFEMTGL